MAQTLVEKILSQKVGREIKAGDEVVVEPDVVMSHDTTTKWAIDACQKYDISKIRYPDRIVIAMDHAFPLHLVEDEERRALMQEYNQSINNFAQMHGITNIFNDPEKPAGICHQILPEKGFVVPGSVILGGDSHSCTYGTYGSFGFGVGSTDIAITWAGGEYLINSVPETILVKLEGELQKQVCSKDIFFELARQLGIGGANELTLEYQGSTLDSLNMDARKTLSNMAVEVGAFSGLISADSTTLNWLRSRTSKPLKKIRADPGADYARTVDIDVDALEPLIACPHSPDNVKLVAELEGLPVDGVFIGTCTNGSISDLETVYKLLKGRRAEIKTLVTPASREVAEEARRRGYYDVFRAAGVDVTETGCSACLGRTTVFPEPNDVVVTTMNRNFKGRMGEPNAKIYLVSPATAAATAVTGYLTTAELLL